MKNMYVNSNLNYTLWYYKRYYKLQEYEIKNVEFYLQNLIEINNFHVISTLP